MCLFSSVLNQNLAVCSAAGRNVHTICLPISNNLFRVIENQVFVEAVVL